MTGVSTRICVRVIARGGKFLADDIGGAFVTIRDAQTKELLAQGVTTGTSGANGPTGVMCIPLRRGQPLPVSGTSAFNCDLVLNGPRFIEVTGYGPLAARESANTVSATQWIYPGKHLTEGNGFLLEMPGLIVQIVEPPTHFAPKAETPLKPLTIRANVAMMCGCPIEPKSGAGRICPELPDPDQPWLPEEFEVRAVIRTGRLESIELPLAFTPVQIAGTAGQFTGTWEAPRPGISEITVYAYQRATGNTGVGVATVVLQSA